MKKALFWGLACCILLTVASVVFCHNTQPTRANISQENSSIQLLQNSPDTESIHDKWTPEQVPQRSLRYPDVGTVQLYGNMTDPASLLLFFSGDGGWNLSVVDMAKTIAQDGQTLVAGIDIDLYYKTLQSTHEKCLYPAGDIENLSEFIQKTLKLPNYLKPVLAGHSSGATLTYALLCQAPVGTFRGGIAFGFCPDVDLDKPLCEGSGKLTMSRQKNGPGYYFTDHAAPGAPLEVMHGDLDKNCDCQTTCDFFEKVANVRVVRLPKVGHGFSVAKSWLPQFKQALARLMGNTNHATGMLNVSPDTVDMAAKDAENSGPDLPLIITQASPDPSKPMVLFLSGDGGWTGFDQQICDNLSANHWPVVGLNSQSYFWKKKTPEMTVADLTPILRQYLAAWGKSTVVLVGYSFGANVAPFIQNRLPADLQAKVKSLVLLSPDPRGDFEIHVAGMLGKGGGPYDVAAEVRSLPYTPVICVSGEQEGNEMQSALQGATHVRFEKIPGSHHYDNNAGKVADAILKAL